MFKRSVCKMVLALLAITAVLLAQSQERHPTRFTVADLDPTRELGTLPLHSVTHTPLPEEYIWTKEDAVPLHPRSNGSWLSGAGLELQPHYFRRVFEVAKVPEAATLYIAGPRSASVYLNGRLVSSYQLNLDFPMGIRVTAIDVTRALRPGKNVLAIEAVRGIEVGSGADSRLSVQQTYGKVLVAKIVPAAPGVVAPPILISDAQWKASMTATAGWQNAGFNEGVWSSADSLGSIESSIEFLQWNADAGLYNWPGYDGISPFLAQYPLAAKSLTHVYSGAGRLTHLGALTQPAAAALAVSADDEFRVELPAATMDVASSPQVLLDFGREVDGRLSISSDAAEASDITVQYGESEAELLNSPYLGVDPLHVPAHGMVFGPKSAFRYALVRFTGGRDIRYKSIQLAGIVYPVSYRGSFESSDPQLNQMWAVGAYTAHLCMQDDIWDAPKRDRGRWMGDLDVSGRTIEDAFGDHFLMERTLDRLLGDAPVSKNVNGIAGYSAFWVTGEAEYWRHTGSRQQLESVHPRLVQLLHFMESELDARSLYANQTHSWPFVDWSPELNGDDPEARRATQFEFYAAFRQGASLLRELHDDENAALFDKRAEALKAAAQQYLLESTGSFGTRWQTNAFAVLSGAAEPRQYDAIWRNSLSSVGHVKYNALIVTPYYNYYVISAMAKMGHRQDALDWIRQYWGGMLDEGATSFWEGYDPSWYKGNFHASLQADNMSGYRVSLAHGWSSGVTPWLMEEVLGIHARAGGFAVVEIRPDLLDLAWAKGSEPTPRGLFSMSLRKVAGPNGTGPKVTETETTLDLPLGTEAHVLVPVTKAAAQVAVNGQSVRSVPAEEGSRATIMLNRPGHYVIAAQ